MPLNQDSMWGFASLALMQIGERDMFCGYCGQRMADGSRFCPNCGMSTDYAGATHAANVPRNARPRTAPTHAVNVPRNARSRTAAPTTNTVSRKNPPSKLPFVIGFIIIFIALAVIAWAFIDASNPQKSPDGTRTQLYMQEHDHDSSSLQEDEQAASDDEQADTGEGEQTDSADGESEDAGGGESGDSTEE